MNYYYAIDGNQTGPVSEEQLAELAAAGTVKPETLVWREGMPAWAPYASIAGGTAQTGVVCTVCKQTFPTDQTVRYGSVDVCASCKPRYLQSLREGAFVGGGLEYAGIGARFGAKFLDNILMYVLNLPLGMLIGKIFGESPATAVIGMILGTTVQLTYTIVLLGWKGQTLGKMATGVKVVNPDGSKISFGKAAGRSFAEILSGCSLSIGYIIAIWDEEKRSLHDRLASTRVVVARKS